MQTIPVKRHQVWRLKYRKRRYLEHVTRDDLSSLARDIVCNLTTLERNGKIGLLNPEAGDGWMELFTHVLEEYSLRRQYFPPGFMTAAPIAKPTWPESPAACAVLERAGFDPARHIVKYGGPYLKNAPDGHWLLTAASRYDDESLGPARQDSELRRTVYGQQDEVKITILNQETREPTETTHPIGNISVTQESMTDYYVMCFSAELNLRLFSDFDKAYDSCVIVRDVREFARRIFAARRRTLRGWSGWMRAVKYYDPLNAPRDRNLFFSKHFRYLSGSLLHQIWIFTHLSTWMPAQ